MNKFAFFIFLVLILNTAFSHYNIETNIEHVLDENLDSYAKYEEKYYGKWKMIMDTIFSQTNYSLESVNKRTSDMEVDSFIIISEREKTSLNFSGRALGIVQVENEKIKVGGRGFVDGICQSFKPEHITSINQSFEVSVEIPEGYVFVSIPENKSLKTRAIDFSYFAWTENNKAKWILNMNVSSSHVIDYCVSREDVEETITQGFIIKKKDHIDRLIEIIKSIAMLILLCAMLLSILLSISFTKKVHKYAKHKKRR